MTTQDPNHNPDDGIIVLADHESSYRDGGEARVLELIQGASDLRSTSHELSTAGTNWPEEYHLTKERANVLRPLTLDPEARVLEIGAGCGAITRYLAEACGQVDALEPVPARARAIRARTRDCDNVTVYVGMLDDLASEPVYDVVFVIGVLEYVAGGTAEREPYLAFLRSIERRLKPGGRLVLAIENKLGVKYLAGAPEDHTDRIFDSLEDYPAGNHARTFTRVELESMISEAGFAPRTFMAFPDYKLTRAVIATDVPDTPPSIYAELPRFPSPDWTRTRPRLASEGRLWTTLVAADTQADFANSFLVIGTKTDGPAMAPLWPEGRIATYYSNNRATWHSVRTDVARTAAGVTFERTMLSDDPTPLDSRAHVAVGTEAFVAGELLTTLLGAAGVGDVERKDLLTRWRTLIDELQTAAPDGSAGAWDALPHNTIVEPSGALRLIDAEWSFAGATWDDIVRRAALLTGMYLALDTWPGAWPNCVTIGDVVRHVGALLELPDGWLDEAVNTEAAFQVDVHGRAHTPDAVRRAQDAASAATNAELARSLTTVPLAPGREQHLETEVARLQAEYTDADSRHRSEIDALRGTVSWKLTRPLRGIQRLVRGIR